MTATADTKPQRQSPTPEARLWHALPVAEVVEQLGTDRGRGLSPEEVRRRRERHGPNELAEAPPEPLLKRFLAQFMQLVVGILIAAALVSGALGEWVDAIAILAIVLLNGLLGFYQEERAGRALAALRNLSAPLARVVRGGVPAAVPARELVPGDLIEVEAGDFVPADARLVEGFAFRVQESALTGESLPVDKDPAAALPESTALGDRRSMVYMGTTAVAGRVTAIVVETSMETELGRIAGALAREEPEPTPLQRRLAELGRLLVGVCLGIVTIVLALELLRGGKLVDVFLTAVSLAVAAVPEGLPAVVTVALALGLQRMVRRNALIRKLPSVETLGCVTVICSDKTGTLTRNEMTVARVLAGERMYAVTGSGYAPTGDFLDEAVRVRPSERADLVLALEAGARCNHTRLAARGDGRWDVVGDPTEGALLVAAAKAGIALDAPRRILFEIPFDSDRKAMSVVTEGAGGARLMSTKGAPEVVLGLCDRERVEGREVPLDPDRRKALLDASAAMAEDGLRVLGIASAPLGPSKNGYVERDLVFLGLAGMKDPAREEAKTAVERCHEAGIRPVMITGDHPVTAVAIARELGIAKAADRAVTGQELDRTSDADLARAVEGTPVYARVSAEHKMRIVRALRGQGHVVAMTGDGVNDATAIKAADIGIAMGTGSDVTKEAADMVLTDDNFASIVNAVEEGRGIYDNIQKFVEYLLSCNLGEVVLMFAASLIGWPVPLFPVQLLWINLVTDGLPALALGLEPPEAGIMQRKPRQGNDPMIPRDMLLRILFQGGLIGLASLAAFGISYGAHPDALAGARTTAFCVIVYAQLLLAFAARSRTIPLARLGLLTNPHLAGAIAISGLLQVAVIAVPFVRPVLKTVEHPAWEWALVAGLSAAPLVVVEGLKWLRAPARPEDATHD